METRASYILVGGFVIGLVALILVAFIWFARVDLDAEPKRYIVHFDGSVTGLSVGSTVRYRGVPIGTVSSIAIDQENIERIQVIIEVAKDTPIKEDMVASLGLQGITGVAFIQLSGGTQASQMLVSERGKPPPVIPSERSGIEALLEHAPILLERAVTVMERIAVVFDEKNLAALAATLENVRTLTDTLAKQSGNIEAVVVDTKATLAALRAASEDVRELSATISKQAGPLSTQAVGTLSDARRTLNDIRRTSASARKAVDLVHAILQDTRRPLQDFSANGLYELAQFLAEARVLVSGLIRLSTQIERDPARFFFGDSQKGFEAK